MLAAEKVESMTNKVMVMSKRSGLAAGSMVALAMLSACATATPYQPNIAVQPGRPAPGGFSEQRIEANRYRVSFAGNSLTSRETVESYLLYRAAELTVAQGYDGFAIAQRQTDRQARAFVQTDPFYNSWYGSHYGHFAPSWRYMGHGHGWNSWDPHMGGPFFGSQMDIRTIQKFEATAEIVMRRGPKSADDPTAFDARAVLENLGPRIQRPAPRA